MPNKSSSLPNSSASSLLFDVDAYPTQRFRKVAAAETAACLFTAAGVSLLFVGRLVEGGIALAVGLTLLYMAARTTAGMSAIGIAGIGISAAGVTLAVATPPGAWSLAVSSLVVLAGAVIFAAFRVRGLGSENTVDKYAAMLIHEGEINCAAARDQRIDFCASLVNLSMKANVPLSIVAFARKRRVSPLDNTLSLYSSPENGIRRYLERLEIGRIIDELRDTCDVVLVDGGRDFVFVTCPGRTAAEAEDLANRIAAAIRTRLEIAMHFAVVERPEFGAAIEHLLGRAAEVLIATNTVAAPVPQLRVTEAADKERPGPAANAA